MLIKMENPSGGGSAFSTPNKVTVPASGTATISASGVTKIIVINYDAGETVIYEGGALKYRIVGSSYYTDPAANTTNVYPSYSGNTITLTSNSSAARNVWVIYE